MLRLRLTPRKRVIATAPGGGGTPPPSGGIVTVPLHERQNGTGYSQPIEGGRGPPQPPDGGGGGTGLPLSGVEEHLSNQWVEEELLHLVVMEVVMGMVMTMEGVVGHLPQGEMEEMVVMVLIMEMAVGEMIHHHCQIKGSCDTVKVREIDGYMWYKDHPDPQANWGKMEGMVRMGKATGTQRNNKCSRSGTCSIRYYWFRKFL